MDTEIRHYIELIDGNPLNAVMKGYHYKAYLVGNLAFNDGPIEAGEHYRLGLRGVYAAMAFCYRHKESIESAIQEALELGYKLGATDIGD